MVNAYIKPVAETSTLDVVQTEDEMGLFIVVPMAIVWII